MKQLGDILLENGLVSGPQLATAFEEHQRSGRSLGRVLVEQGVLSEGQLVAALATQIGLRFVDLTDFAVDGSAEQAASSSGVITPANWRRARSVRSRWGSPLSCSASTTSRSSGIGLCCACK